MATAAPLDPAAGEAGEMPQPVAADQFPLAGEEVAERNSRTIATDASGLVLQHSCGTTGRVLPAMV